MRKIRTAHLGKAAQTKSFPMLNTRIKVEIAFPMPTPGWGRQNIRDASHNAGAGLSSAQAVQDAIKRVSEASRAAGFALADQADGTKSYFSELSDVLSTISFPEQMKGLASGFSSLFAHLEDLRKKDSASWNDYASGILTGLSGALSSVQSFSATVFEKTAAWRLKNKNSYPLPETARNKEKP